MRKLICLSVLMLVVLVGCSDNQDTGEIDVLRSTVELQKDQITTIRELVSVINLSNEELKMVLQANQLKLDKVFSGQLEVNQTVENLVKENESIEKRFENLVDSVETLVKENESMEKRFENLVDTDDLDPLVKSVENLAKENDLIEKRFEALDGNGDNGDFDVLSEAVKNLSSQINDLKPELNEGIESLKDQFNQFVKDNGDLAPQVAKLDKRVQELAAQLNVLDKKGNGAVVDVAAQKQEIEKLISQLQDKDGRIRSIAAEALGVIGEGAVDATSALIQALKDQDVHGNTAWALGKMGMGAVPLLVLALKDPSAQVRSSVASALGAIGSKDAVPALIQALKDESIGVRRGAAEALREIGSKDAVLALIQALELRPYSVGFHFYMVGILGGIGEDAVPALIQALKDESIGVRRGAAEALVTIESEDAVPALVKAFQDPEAWVRYSVLRALVTIESEDAVPVLALALKDKGQGPGPGPSYNIYNYAVEELRKMGTRAVGAVPALIQALKDPDSRVSNSVAVELLVSIGKGAVPALIQALKDEDNFQQEDVSNPSVYRESVCYSAMKALSGIGEEAIDAVPALIPLLQDHNRFVRSDATGVLGSIGKGAVPALIQALKGEDKLGDRGRGRVNAMKALSRIGEEAIDAVPALISLLQDKDQDEDVRSDVAGVLGNIGSKDAVLALIQVFKDVNEVHHIRSKAGSALHTIGTPEALAAVN